MHPDQHTMSHGHPLGTPSEWCLTCRAQREREIEASMDRHPAGKGRQHREKEHVSE